MMFVTPPTSLATKGRGEIQGGGHQHPTHLVAKTGVTTSDAVFVTWTNGETHMSVESRCPELVFGFVAAWWGRGLVGWVVVKVEEDGGGSADVGVAAIGVVFDGLGRVEREERERCTGGLFRALHLQD
jgi:hypothetical protein